MIDLFHHLTGRSRHDRYRKLLVAPDTMRPRFLDMIEREAKLGKRGKIVAKMNQLQDPDIIRALYAASQAGVKIDLIVRGFCCIKPGVKGLSETIHVRSILGQFLEHSRVYQFGNDGKPEVYIGSADWMSRNLSNRVEAITPVEEPRLRDRLIDLMATQLADEVHHFTLHGDGSWTRSSTAEQRAATPDPQQILMQQTIDRRD